MTIQLTFPVVDKFDSKRKRTPKFMDSEPKLKKAKFQIVELPVAGGEFMER